MRRAILAGAALGALTVLMAGSAAAISSPGCDVTGTSTSGDEIDLSSASVWHVQSTDHVAVTATTGTPQTEFAVNLVVLGVEVPIASGEPGDATDMDWAEYDMDEFAFAGRVFVVSGASSGPDGGCTASFTVVVDDVDPLTTFIGGGSVGLVGVGAAAGMLAIRNAKSGGRRIGGLLGATLGLAGGSLLTQQLSDPSSPGFVLGSAAFVESVPGILGVSLDPLAVAETAALALAVVLLLPFPSELFNRTLETHLDDIRGWLRGLPLIGGLIGSGEAEGTGAPSWGRRLGVIGFVLVAGALYGLLDPGFGIDLRSGVTYLGIVAALVLVTWLAELPRRSARRAETGDGGRLHAVLGTLVIAAACVVISRATGFLPGYLYGLLLGYSYIRAVSSETDARALSAGAWWMLLLALVAWVMLGAVRSPGVGDTVPGEIMESVLAAFVVAGIEGIVFGLVPLRFMKGAEVFAWSRFRWGLLYAAGVFAFTWIILNPVNGFVAMTGEGSFVTAMVLFFGFALVSGLFWAFFWVRGKRAAT